MHSAFLVSGFKIIVNSLKSDTVSVTAIREDTYQTFECLSKILTKISPSTIQSAFKKESQALKYSLTQQQKKLTLQILVELQFLPRISEIIEMQLIESNEASQRVIFAELKQQIYTIQQDLNQMQSGKDSPFLINFNGTTNDNQLINKQCQIGSYLLQLSGEAAGYNEECYDEYVQNMPTQLNLIIRVYDSKSAEKQLQNEYTFKFKVNTQQGYSYIFTASQLINLSKLSNVCIVAKSARQSLSITSSLFIMTRVNYN